MGNYRKGITCRPPGAGIVNGAINNYGIVIPK